MTRGLSVVLVLLATGSGTFAQDAIPIPPSRTLELGQGARTLDPSGISDEIAADTASSAPGGVVRVLDKIDGTTTDLELRTGQTQEVGSLSVTLGDCRYPADNPAGDAYILLSIRTNRDDAAVFEGWMIASAPALNALDHPRYDVWALRCLDVPASAAPTE